MNYTIRVYKEGSDYGITISENNNEILTRIITEVHTIFHLIFLFKTIARDKLVRVLELSRYKSTLKEILDTSRYV